MIKAIIFDFGNVICKFDNNIFLKRFAEHSDKLDNPADKLDNPADKSFNQIKDLIYGSENSLEKQYESGIISSDEFYEIVKKRGNLRITKEDFIKYYTGIFTPIETTFDLIKKLKKHYKIGLLSNTSEWDFEYGIKPTEVYKLFDSVTLSFKVRHMKPAKEIYLDALKKMNCRPDECVYIDDIKKYSDAAGEIGIYGINYISYNDLVLKLKPLLPEVGFCRKKNDSHSHPLVKNTTV